MEHVAKLMRQTKFTQSAPSLKQCPVTTGLEVAFAGRSNAGKSSAINALANQKKLAKTSKTPGRTQLINFFALDEQRFLVDLPGYGYAKVPIKMKQQWQAAMGTYLEKRDNLQGVILMMDVRHPFTEFDQMMMEWAQHYAMPMHILLTKADKLKRGAAQNTLLQVRKALPDGDVSFSVQLFSAMKKQGLNEAYAVLGEWLDIPEPEAES